MTTPDMDQDVIDRIQSRFDIDDDAVERGLTDTTNLPDRLEWMYWLPNGYLMNWKDYSIRERAIMISVGFHMNWKLEDLKAWNEER